MVFGDDAYWKSTVEGLSNDLMTLNMYVNRIADIAKSPGSETARGYALAELKRDFEEILIRIDTTMTKLKKGFDGQFDGIKEAKP